MSKPNFDPLPQHMWVVKVYPGGRSQWEQMHLLSAAVVYASAKKAARVLARGYHTYTTDEHVAAAALQLAGQEWGA